MNPSTPYVIETHELGKTYKKVQALQSLDLKVQQNSIFGFLGPNGAGKTTTIKLLLGFVLHPHSHPAGILPRCDHHRFHKPELQKDRLAWE